MNQPQIYRSTGTRQSLRDMTLSKIRDPMRMEAQVGGEGGFIFDDDLSQGPHHT